jgi:hypothetical protein
MVSYSEQGNSGSTSFLAIAKGFERVGNEEYARYSSQRKRM